MNWIPGWDSIAGANWWANFYFWGSIVSLILLGVTEVVSHRYTNRQDELTAIEEQATKRQHDDEIARAHLEAENAKTEALNALTQAVRAGTLASRVHEFVAWRQIRPNNFATLCARLKKSSGSVWVLWQKGDPEAQGLSERINSAFRYANDFAKSAQWTYVNRPTESSKLVFGLTVFGDNDATVELVSKTISLIGFQVSNVAVADAIWKDPNNPDGAPDVVIIVGGRFPIP